MASRSTTKRSSRRPRMPKMASGIISSGEMRYMTAAMKHSTMRSRNMYMMPPTEKNSEPAWRSRVGRSRRWSSHCASHQIDGSKNWYFICSCLQLHKNYHCISDKRMLPSVVSYSFLLRPLADCLPIQNFCLRNSGVMSAEAATNDRVKLGHHVKILVRVNSFVTMPTFVDHRIFIWCDVMLRLLWIMCW